MIAAHKNVRILVSLLKQHNIRHIVCSPGSRNMSIVKSVEDDPFFTCYSVVDERSAAYFAVGLSLELRASVAISCTSAQATRNYIPGLTEAYYRKAPILAITADYDENITDQLNMQSLRQMSIPSDCANVSVDIPVIRDEDQEHMATRRINQAIDSLTRNGGGPAHINMRIAKHWARGDDKLEMARKITRHNLHSGNWPSLDGKKIMIAVGQHHSFSDAGQQALEEFVSKYNAVVYVNHISNYHGAGSVNGNIRLFTGHSKHLCPDIAITIGGHFGDYAVDSFFRTSPIEHWRVAEDGNYSDSYSKLKHVFECRELDFFSCMNQQAGGTADHSYLELWQDETDSLTLPETYPLSQAMVAQKLSPSIPSGSVLHFAILNSMRFWEFFPLDHSIRCYCNVAGFGIDGCLSTFLGQSVASEQLCYLVIGDLSFFYDMNSLGIRCLKNNIRIILVNNNGGCEFRLKSNAADKFGDDSNRHIAATDHFGESAEGWVRNNGFNYIGVRSEDELNAASSIMASPSDKPVLMEVFTTIKDDAQALQIINMHLHDQLDLSSGSVKAIKNIRRTVGQHLSRDMKDKLKRFLK